MVPKEDYGQIKVYPGKKSDVAIDVKAGSSRTIECRIKNKAEKEWPCKLNWCNDYSKPYSMEIPHKLHQFEAMSVFITFKIPKNFGAYQNIEVNFKMTDEEDETYGQPLKVTL